MRHRHLFAAAAVLVTLSCLLAADEPATVRSQSFKVFDNMAYEGKPDTAPLRMLNCNIIYDGVWGSKAANGIPDESKFKKAIQARSKKPGPVVIDIEGLWLTGKSEDVEPRFKVFLTLVKWAHEAAPGHPVGYYGHGLFPEEPGKEYKAQAKELAGAVDAFFPSMYTFNDDRQAWSKKAEGLVKAAHEIAPNKPVYFYIWPQYHNHAPKKALQFLTGDDWSYELGSSQDIGADGVVMWSPRKPAWNAHASWWEATLKFLR